MGKCSNCVYSGRVLLSGMRVCLLTKFRYHVNPVDCCPDYRSRYYIRPFIEVRFMMDFYGSI